MIGSALAAMRLLLPGSGTLILWCAITLAAGGAVTWFGVHERNIGWHNAIASVAAQDKEAVDAVEKHRSTRIACVTAGGVWRQASGECERR